MHEHEPHDDLPASILEAARAYRTPPDTPREELWQAIQATRQGRRADGWSASMMALPRLATDRPAVVVPMPRRRRFRWLRWISASLAAAAGFAMLLLLPDAGTQSAATFARVEDPLPTSSASTPVAAERMPAMVDDIAVRLAIRDHLGRTERLLALAHEELRAGDADAAVLEPARDLLLDTRLLLNLTEAAEADLTELLLALELTLVQLAHVEINPTAEEIRFAAAEIETAELLPRLHALVDAGRDEIGN
jgi:hypothetical protein